jgi:hypothetical protein
LLSERGHLARFPASADAAPRCQGFAGLRLVSRSFGVDGRGQDARAPFSPKNFSPVFRSKKTGNPWLSREHNRPEQILFLD